jgi:CRISPR/Cas system CMR-associated protein Cmr3 (group 5 of RAMP superfamily)
MNIRKGAAVLSIMIISTFDVKLQQRDGSTIAETHPRKHVLCTRRAKTALFLGFSTFICVRPEPVLAKDIRRIGRFLQKEHRETMRLKKKKKKKNGRRFAAPG